MIQLTSVESNRQWLDGGSMFGNAPRTVWQKWTEVDDKGRIPLACRCLLIEWNNLKILCEAGIGAFFEPKLAERFGVQNSEKNQLVENLKQAGVNPSEIDYVILSHLHFDHAGGLLPAFSEMQNGSSDLVFSKAQFIVGEKAWKRALHPHMRDRASFIPMLNKKLEESGRLQIISDNKAPEPLNEIIDFFESNGHTPGQMHTLIKGQQQSVIFAGDLIPGSPLGSSADHYGI
jgi:Cft2 family RNA processing exonuclease